MDNKSEQNQVVNQSNDASFFTITPRIVWALARSPYDYTLWCVIKDIAGERGECYISTPDLASLAMMSAGKVSECRQYLLSVGLLQGELRRDPGYPQPVWHLRVPDLWARNMTLAQRILPMRTRITYKKDQKSKLSLHESTELSPGERGITPHEKGLSPGETKNNIKKNQKEDLSPDGDRAIAVEEDAATIEREWFPDKDKPLAPRRTEAECKASLRRAIGQKSRDAGIADPTCERQSLAEQLVDRFCQHRNFGGVAGKTLRQWQREMQKFLGNFEQLHEDKLLKSIDDLFRDEQKYGIYWTHWRTPFSTSFQEQLQARYWQLCHRDNGDSGTSPRVNPLVLQRLGIAG